jgi:hypothetical protein
MLTFSAVSFAFGLADTLLLGYLLSAWRRGVCTRHRYVLEQVVAIPFWILDAILVVVVIPTSNHVGSTVVLCGHSGGCQSSRLIGAIGVLAFLNLYVIPPREFANC